eukprot:365625-Chlamydomonas_euryale.AAC.7
MIDQLFGDSCGLGQAASRKRAGPEARIYACHLCVTSSQALTLPYCCNRCSLNQMSVCPLEARATIKVWHPLLAGKRALCALIRLCLDVYPAKKAAFVRKVLRQTMQWRAVWASSLLKHLDATFKSHKDVGWQTVVGGGRGAASTPPLMHIHPAVVSRVLFAGMAVDGEAAAPLTTERTHILGASIEACCALGHAVQTCQFSDKHACMRASISCTAALSSGSCGVRGWRRQLLSRALTLPKSMLTST